MAFQNAANRREFFVKFALGTGLDPLVPENWYNVDQQKIMATKVRLLSFTFIIRIANRIQGCIHNNGLPWQQHVEGTS